MDKVESKIKKYVSSVKNGEIKLTKKKDESLIAGFTLDIDNTRLDASIKKRLNMIYVRHTNQKISAVEKALDRDNFMTPEQSLEWGIIDKIIDRREMDASDKAE